MALPNARQRGVELRDRGRVGALLRAVGGGRAARADQRVRHVGGDDEPAVRGEPRIEAARRRSARARPARRRRRAARVPSRPSKRTPSARSRPLPPSVVADPPSPIVIRSTPASSAARTTSPVPRVEARRALSGVRSSGGKPREAGRGGHLDERSAALVEQQPVGRDRPAQRVGGRRPSRRSAASPSAAATAASVPSPPSAIGSAEDLVVRPDARPAAAIAAATATESSAPPNESGATRTRSVRSGSHDPAASALQRRGARGRPGCVSSAAGSRRRSRGPRG